MSVVLMTREAADRSLMHYRVGGEKKGVRRWQDTQGHLTSAGYLHYKAMYGWGDKKKGSEAEKKPAVQKSDKEIESEVKGKVSDFNEKKKSRAEERKSKHQEMLNQQKEARNLSDEELNKRINRLNQEKAYAKLLKEREDREKSEFSRTVSKLVKNAAEDLGKKGLTMVVDQIISKAKDKAEGKMKINLGDYKNVDIYSLDSEKIAAISKAFQDAANLSRNRYAITHPGGGNDNQEGNKQKNNSNQNNGNQQKNPSQNNQNAPKQNNSGDSNGNQISKKQQKKMRAMANSGKSAAEIAKALGVSESTVQNYAGEQLKAQKEKEEKS